MTRDTGSQSLRLPVRQVHLDFHNSPLIPDIGADWDADDFVARLIGAHVTSVTLFAKCHHGMSYYPSRVAPQHPSLTFDLLGSQLRAVQSAGIRAPIYVSVGWDVYAADAHVEWRQFDSDGRPIGPLDGQPGWPWLCLNTPYAEYVLAQLEEILGTYRCDGFFFDIVWTDERGCYCPTCVAEIRAAGGDPTDMHDREAQADAVARRFMARAAKVIGAAAPEATVFFNSRFGLRFVEEVSLYSHVELESLPTGGYGYGHFPLWSRFARTTGLPVVGMTGRFQGDWADWSGLKSVSALAFEAGTILATGDAVSIGDQLHPRGRLSPVVYDVIGGVFGPVEEIEPYCIDATGAAEIALLALERPAADPSGVSPAGLHPSIEGAAKMLVELHQQFDVIGVMSGTRDLTRYRVVILPDRGAVDAALAEELRTFLASGGALIASHRAGLDEQAGEFALADEMGVRYIGMTASSPDYFEILESSLATSNARVGFIYGYDLGSSTHVHSVDGTTILAVGHESYFNRTTDHFSSHGVTAPRLERAAYPAVTQHGRVVYLHGPVFAAYARRGSLVYRDLVGSCLTQVMPDPILLTSAPPTVEVSLRRQGDRWVVHLANYHAERRSPGHVEVLSDPVPLRDVSVGIRVDTPIGRVMLAPAADLPFDRFGDLVTTTVPVVGSHAVVVFGPSNEGRW